MKRTARHQDRTTRHPGDEWRPTSILARETYRGVALVVLASLSLAACRFTFDRALNPGDLRAQALASNATGTTETWAPAPGTVVTVQQTPFAATTDGNGRVLVSSLPPGTYAVTFVHQTHGPPGDFLALRGITLAPGDGRDLGALKLNAAGALQGQVLLNGVPVPNAALQVVDSTLQPIPGIAVQRSDAQGAYALPFVPTGETQVHVIFPTTSAAGTPLQDGLSDPVQVLPRVTTHANLNLHSTQVDGPATLELDATAPLGVTPPRTISVQLVRDDGTTTTSAGLPAAAARITMIPPGMYTVLVSAPGFQVLPLPNELIVGTDNLGVVVLQPGATETGTCLTMTSACDPNASCAASPAGVTCTCNPGYSGSGWYCIDVDECGQTPHPCDPNATCANTPGSYTCTCKPGFTGNGTTCTVADACLTANGGCDPNASCVSASGVVACTCKPGYAGDGMTCQSLCTTGDAGCDSSATCSNVDGGVKCTCEPGYTGNGTTCESLCNTGGGGCDLNASCSNVDGGVLCTCEPGYVGNGTTCTSVCSAGDAGCDLNASCSNVDGGTLCTCEPGYIGSGTTCESVCAAGDAGCDLNASCSNVAGGVLCTCGAGYAGNGHTCESLCDTGDAGCDPNASCANVDGGVLCTCEPGYVGSGTTCESLCSTGDAGCDPNASCANVDGGVQCTCEPGYTGNGASCASLCGTANGGCDLNNATCSNGTMGVVCQCNFGFAGGGYSCAPIDVCALPVSPCAPDATCANSYGSYTCTCPPNSVGDGVTCQSCLLPTAMCCETEAAFCQRLSATCGLLTAPDTCGNTFTADCGSCTGGQVCGLDTPNTCGSTGTITVGSLLVSALDMLEAPALVPATKTSVYSASVSLGNQETSVLPQTDGGVPPILVTTTVDAPSVTASNGLTALSPSDGGSSDLATRITVTDTASVSNQDSDVLLQLDAGLVATATASVQCIVEAPPEPAAFSPQAYVQNQ